ncbi:hypothetical protein [Flavobacterium defluvii]|uniref:Type II secretion system protein GspC N-terminal domain-containing protein n=1 Tax=Flavobacterium defluvii TaxID=370979 RepID=A0A1M5WK97_9FLAO|nr:hypothetical protein [Flavobacterium defluvii]SHH87935.1 hypothetical protein SAMN05443663_11439 [Flavobacterium defluvii]
MKNKKNIYILLPLVLFVWGAVLFQVFSFTNADEIIPESNPEFGIKPLKINKRESFSININYRDPFLGKMYNPETVLHPKTISAKTVKVIKKAEPLVWPNIIYKGLISDTKGKSKIFMLIIDGKNYYMKVGDTENEIFLKDGDKESVYVKYKGNLNLIMLQD